MKSNFKFKFLMPLLALALTFSVGINTARADVFKSDTSKHAVTGTVTAGHNVSEATLPTAVKLVRVESYKLDDAEYTAAVATKSSLNGISLFGGAGAALIGLFALFSNLFQESRSRLKSLFTVRNVAVLSICLLTIVAVYFLSPDTDPSQQTLATVPILGLTDSATAIKALKEQKADKIKQMDALIDDVTEDGVKKYDALKSEVEQLNVKLGRLDDKLVREKEAALHISPVGDGNKHESEGDRKDLKRFNWHKIIRSQINEYKESLDGIEAEMSQEGKKEATEAGVTPLGVALSARLFKPTRRNQRDINVGTAASAGNLVETSINEFVPALRPTLFSERLGAKLVTGLVGNIDLVRKTGEMTASWAATENAAQAESQWTTDKVTLTPKRLAATIDISKQLLAQSSIDVQALSIEDMEAQIKIAVDAAFINGSGASGQPTGLLQDAGIQTLALGANGLAPTRAHLIDLEALIATVNAETDNMAMLTTPQARAFFKKLATDVGSGLFVWDRDNTLLGYKAYATNQVPTNLVKGASGAVCDAIILGDFSSGVIANWAGLDLVVDPYSRKKEAIVEVTINTWWDIARRYPKMFAAIKDALV